jgi:uncharacterized protein DUF3943
MKYIIFFTLLIFPLGNLFAQNTTVPDTTKHVPKQDTIDPNKGDIKGQLKEIKEIKKKLLSDSIRPDSMGNQPHNTFLVDTVVQNKYGDLLRDDTAYNKRYSIWIPLVEGIGDNVILSLVDSRIFNYSWAKVDLTSWKNNFNAGFPWSGNWDWDQTRFGNDFLGHPYFGNLYYNDARSNGYNFWASAPFALLGSYEWKICGENITPERNSLIATTVDGIILGEILYRVTSNILDDRTEGTDRFFREFAATLLNPMRGLNRWLQGKTSRHSNKEVYQKEPLNLTLNVGELKINDHTNAIFSGQTSEIINVQLDYGNPFEVRARQPFDFFKIRTELDFGVGRKIVDNITCYGVLFSKNEQKGKFAYLEGIFLNYDYWDNPNFELSTIGLGPSIFTKLPIGKTSNLYTNVQLALVPFGGASTGPISDTSQARDFNFNYGAEAKFETSLALGERATIGVAYYYFFLHCINSVGQDEPTGAASLGNNSLGIVEPKITLQVYKHLAVGFEYYLYAQTHTNTGYETYNSTQTEQRVFLQFYFEDPQRRGHYN